MGAYLSEPITEKHSSDYEGINLKCGASSMQGWRVSQEVSNLIGLLAVYFHASKNSALRF